MASKNSELEVTALAHCHAAISPLFAVTSAHIRNPGCRYHDLLISRPLAGFAFSLDLILSLYLLE